MSALNVFTVAELRKAKRAAPGDFSTEEARLQKILDAAVGMSTKGQCMLLGTALVFAVQEPRRKALVVDFPVKPQRRGVR